jgi:hypothetical protein
MRSRSALIAFVAAATTLALVGLKQPKTVALPSLGRLARESSRHRRATLDREGPELSEGSLRSATDCCTAQHS